MYTKKILILTMILNSCIAWVPSTEMLLALMQMWLLSIDKRSVDRTVGKNVVSDTLEYAPYLLVLSWRTNVLHLIFMSLQRLFCLHRLRSYCATRSAPKLNHMGGLRRAVIA